MSQKSETKASSDLYKPLLRKGWWIRKLHGNVFQSGLLDYVLCRPKDGLIMQIEMKHTWSSVYQYTQLDIIAKLKGPQIATFKTLVHLKAKVGLVMTSPCGVYFVKPPLALGSSVIPMTDEEFHQALENW